MTNALKGRTSSTYLIYFCRWSCHLFTHHTGPLIEQFTTHNSI